MDASRFTDSKTGQLHRITSPDGGDWAFVPNRLPPDWVFPSRLWPLLAEAREELARLDQKGQAVRNSALLLTPLQRREALRSSSLEGTYATPEELLLYELNPSEPKARNDPAHEWREVANYSEALRHGFRRLKDSSPSGLPLSGRLVREMQRMLLQDGRGNDALAGHFRTRQVHVGSDRRYVPPPAGDVLTQCMGDLETYLNDHGDTYDPLVLSYLVHYQFEAIHPFLDGNGRVGRALLALTTFAWNRLYLPWLYMSAYFERYKDEYIDNLFRVSTHGDWDTWIEFCLRGTVAQCRDALQRCNKLDELREYMHREADPLSPRMHVLIEKMFEIPAFKASHVAKWGASSMPTARADIQRLIKAGFVQHLQGQRPQVYYARPIFDVAHSENEDDLDVAPDQGEGSPSSDSTTA